MVWDRGFVRQRTPSARRDLPTSVMMWMRKMISHANFFLKMWGLYSITFSSFLDNCVCLCLVVDQGHNLFFCLQRVFMCLDVLYTGRVMDCCSQSHCWYWPWSELFIVKLQWKRWVTDLFSSVMYSAEVWLKISEEARCVSIKSSRYQVFLVQKQVFSTIQQANSLWRPQKEFRTEKTFTSFVFLTGVHIFIPVFIIY